MSKVALPIEDGRLCSLFEEANLFRVFTTEDCKTIDENLLTVRQHQSDNVPLCLYEYGVTDVFVNRISHESIHKFNHLKINVFVGVEIKSPEVLIEEHLCGILETNGSFVDR